MVREGLRFLASVYTALRSIYWDVIENENKTISLKVLQNDTIQFHRSGDITKILFSQQHIVKYHKSFEYKTLELVRNNIKDGDIVMDVGANIGLFSLLVSRHVGEQGKVFAFEPTEETYNLLLRNIELNGNKNIHPFKLPLADKKMRIKMVNPGKSNHYKDAFNRIAEIQKTEIADSTMYTSTLDAFVIENCIERIDFIKVDIEGSELLFFKGAINTLSIMKPKIIFEANENHTKEFGYKVIDVLVFLHNLGYNIYQVNEEQWFAT
jgi:FkbM family methyltransferase